MPILSCLGILKVDGQVVTAVEGMSAYSLNVISDNYAGETAAVSERLLTNRGKTRGENKILNAGAAIEGEVAYFGHS